MGNTQNKVTPVSNEKKRKFILGIIDPQNDFFQGGALAVPDSQAIIGPINKLRFFCVDLMDTFVSQDFHPPNHMSFAQTHQTNPFIKKELEIKLDGINTTHVTQDMWPTHCVQGTPGAQAHKDIIITQPDHIFRKGTNPNIESYSAFGDEFTNKYENTGLDNFLKSKCITDIVLVGLATDFCVYNTALDAIRLGYSVHLIKSCVRAVFPDKVEQLYVQMEAKGICIYQDVEDFLELCLLDKKN